MPGRPPEWAAALAVVATAGVLAATAARPVMPPFLPIGDYASYTDRSPRAAALVEPVAHAPWLGAVGAPAAVVIAGAVLLCLWITTRRAGAGMAAAAVTALAWAARPDIAVPWTLGTGPVVAVALLWASLLACARSTGRRWPGTSVPDGSARGLVAVACAAGAFALWPPLAVLAPLAIAAGAAATPWLGAWLAAGSAGGVAMGLHAWALRASALAGDPVSWLDVWHVVTSPAAPGTDPFPWPPMAAAALPVVIAFVGAVVAGVGMARRAWWAAGALMSVAAAVAPHAWHAEATRALYWVAWPLVGVGLTWFVSQAAPRAQPLALLAIGVVVIGGGVSARVRDVQTLEARAFASALSSALSGLSTRPVVLVTEDTRLDTATVAWDGGATVSRVRPVPALVSAAEARGHHAFAGASSRAVLELWGFRFRPGAEVAEPVRFELAAVRGRFRCVDVSSRWSELAGLEYTGRLGVHLPRGTGRVEVVVAGAPPLIVRASTADGRPAGRLTSGPATTLSSLPPVLWPGDGRVPDAATTAARFDLQAHPDHATDASLMLGARAPLVGARVIGADLAATICAAPLPRLDPFDAAQADAAGVAMDDDAFFAGGWHGAEGSGAAAFRWTTGRALTLLPSSRSSAVALAIEARPAARLADGLVLLRVTVNGAPAGAQVLTDVPQTYTWKVPAAIWVEGTNEIALDVTRTMRPSGAGGADTRELGVAVSAIRLRR